MFIIYIVCNVVNGNVFYRNKFIFDSEHKSSQTIIYIILFYVMKIMSGRIFDFYI